MLTGAWAGVRVVGESESLEPVHEEDMVGGRSSLDMADRATALVALAAGSTCKKSALEDAWMEAGD